jgi:hypothetical protein
MYIYKLVPFLSESLSLLILPEDDPCGSRRRQLFDDEFGRKEFISSPTYVRIARNIENLSTKITSLDPGVSFKYMYLLVITRILPNEVR